MTFELPLSCGFRHFFNYINKRALQSDVDLRQNLTPIYQSLPLIMGQLLQQKYADMAYLGKFDHKFAVKH